MTASDTSESGDPANAKAGAPTRQPRWGLLERYRFLTFVLPLAVFLVGNMLEPKPPEKSVKAATSANEFADEQTGSVGGALEIVDSLDSERVPTGYVPYRYYPLVYTFKIALTLAAMVFVWPGYRAFPWRASPLALAVGVVGAVLWIGLCKLGLEARILRALSLDELVPLGTRSAFNPLAELAATPLLAYGFLGVRFFGLCCVVPVIEEFFLRGFVMRFVMHADWWQIPFGSVNRTAVLVGTAVPLMMHLGGEMLAAVVWFTLVTWLMVRTRNIWDCVVAHAVTNFLLGVYVVLSGDWWLM